MKPMLMKDSEEPRRDKSANQTEPEESDRHKESESHNSLEEIIHVHLGSPRFGESTFLKDLPQELTHVKIGRDELQRKKVSIE